MTRVYLEKVGRKFKEVEHSDFWLDLPLYKKLNSIKKIVDKNWDAVILVDGRERSGKSTLAMSMGWYLSNGNLTIDNFARGIDDVAEKIAKIPDKSVLIFDEAGTIFSSKDSMSKEQKALMKIMEVVGQKNLVFIVVLPSFFSLNKEIAIRRSQFLCHVSSKNYERKGFQMYGENRKQWLYILGKKKNNTYNVTKANLTCEFQHFTPPFYDEYLEKVKKESLQQVLDAATNGKKAQGTDPRLSEGQMYLYMHKTFQEPIAKLKNVKGEAISTIKLKMFDYWYSKTGVMPSKLSELTT